MRKFEKKFRKPNFDPYFQKSDGGLHNIYYHSKRIRLLLDLMSACLGIGPCLKLFCLFDKNLYQDAQVENLQVILQDSDSDGSKDVIVKFNDAKAVVETFSHISNVSCNYAVEITPSLKSVIFF